MSFASLLKRFFPKPSTTIRNKRHLQRFRPTLELLEDRVTPTTTVNVSTYTDAAFAPPSVRPSQIQKTIRLS